VTPERIPTGNKKFDELLDGGIASDKVAIVGESPPAPVNLIEPIRSDNRCEALTTRGGRCKKVASYTVHGKGYCGNHKPRQMALLGAPLDESVDLMEKAKEPAPQVTGSMTDGEWDEMKKSTPPNPAPPKHKEDTFEYGCSVETKKGTRCKKPYHNKTSMGFDVCKLHYQAWESGDKTLTFIGLSDSSWTAV
jgi:hypothetical protein